MASREERAREVRLRRAATALTALTDAERRQVFREAGLCHCAQVEAFALDHPVSAIGAGLGAIVGPPILRGLARVLLSAQATTPAGGKR